MAIECFNAYHSYLDSMELLSDEEAGRLFRACLAYSRSGSVGELSGNERFVFPAMRAQIDRDRQKYADKCRKNAENVRARYDSADGDGATTVYDGSAAETDTTNVDKDKDKDKGTDRDKEKEKEKEKDKDKTKDKGKDKERDRRRQGARFTPPALEEVEAYVKERGSCVDAQDFIDFYAKKGWLVGKTLMADWRAACRNAEQWERYTEKPVQKSAALRRAAEGVDMAQLQRVVELI